MARRHVLAAVIGLAGAVLCWAAASALLAYVDSRPTSTRIVLYGDSLSMQSAQDFEYLASEAAAPVLLRAYGGWALCDVLPGMEADVRSWEPSVAVIEFSGNSSTACMKGYPAGTERYFAKYRRDIETAVGILRRHHVRVILAGAPHDIWPNLTANVVRLNDIYATVAAAHEGVIYADAGQSVMADGAFTWRLPCLDAEPCTGIGGTNLVRAPDGIHFCPSGRTTVQGSYDVCSVHSSGALRFAMALLAPALGVEHQHGRSARPPRRASWRPAQAGASRRAFSSALSTLPVGLRGRVSTKTYRRGTL